MKTFIGLIVLFTSISVQAQVWAGCGILLKKHPGFGGSLTHAYEICRDSHVTCVLLYLKKHKTTLSSARLQRVCRKDRPFLDACVKGYLAQNKFVSINWAVKKCNWIQKGGESKSHKTTPTAYQ